MQTVPHGKSTQEEGEQFVKAIQHNSEGEAPLFLSDGWPSYPEIFARTSSHEEPGPYSGRGRPRKPMRVSDANLKYAQVMQRKAGGRLLESEQRVIWGTAEEMRDSIQHEGRGQTITTS